MGTQFTELFTQGGTPTTLTLEQGVWRSFLEGVTESLSYLGYSDPLIASTHTEARPQPPVRRLGGDELLPPVWPQVFHTVVHAVLNTLMHQTQGRSQLALQCCHSSYRVRVCWLCEPVLNPT